MNNFIEWNSLDFSKDSGRESLRCPSCDNNRTDKKDKSLKIYHNDGVGKCFYCESLTFRDSEESYVEKSYTLPEQTWKNYTNISDNLIKFVEEKRKIRQSTLIDLGITEEKFYQPKHKKEVNNIVFNYFEGEKVVNKKYRSADKSFTQTTGGKPIFYNINSVIGQSEVYIVEGEFDVLALHSHGIKNVISVPNGANDNDDYWKNSEIYLKDVKEFVIAVDNDTKGNDLKDKIAQRLGRYRCKFIEWTNKDANGSLINKTIDSDLNNAKRFPVSGTWKIEDLKEGIYNLYNNGLPETISPKNACFGDLSKVFSIMEGQLTVTTGIPSHGKSNFVEWWMLNIVKDYDKKCSMFTPEHSPMELHQTTLIQKAVGRNFWKDKDGRPRITPQDIERYVNWANEKIYITLPENGEEATWDWIFDKFKEQMYSFGVNIFVIDAFNKIQLPKGNKLEEINTVLSRLTSFCQINNVSVLLVAHPTKMKKNDNGSYEVPTLYDVSGSSDFRNQAHNGFAIHRYFETDSEQGYTEFINLKTKFSFQGEIGKRVEFTYDDPTGRMYAKGTPAPLFDLTLSDELETSIKPSIEFEEFEGPLNEIEF